MPWLSVARHSAIHNRRVMRPIRRIAVALLPVVALIALACGSDGGAQPAGSAGDETLEPVPVLHEGSTFTIDQLIEAGWKRSKELSAETLPNAESAWYGFYNRRDVEVRIYPSHASAVADGTGPADEATGRGKPAPFAVGGISATRTSYGAYAIVGNLVVLCEVQISECIDLLESLG